MSDRTMIICTQCGRMTSGDEATFWEGKELCTECNNELIEKGTN